jgi:hypothetical protein
VRCAAQVLPLTEYIFNTEAHPLPLLNSPKDQELAGKLSYAPEGIDLQGGNYSSEVLQQAIDHYRAILPRTLYSQASKDRAPTKLVD